MSWVTEAKDLAECAHLNSSLAARWKSHDRVMREAAARFDLDYALVAAVGFVESKWNHSVKSGAGAEGLFQTMPSTGAEMAKRLGIKYRPYNAAASALMGAQYLRLLINKFGYRLNWVIAGYNAGAGAVQKYQGVPPFDETQRFVPAVKKAMVAIGAAERRCVTGSGTLPKWGRASYSQPGSWPLPRPQPSPSAPSSSGGSSGGTLVALVVLGGLIYVGSGTGE